MSYFQMVNASDRLLNGAAHGRVAEVQAGLDQGGDVNHCRTYSTPVALAVEGRHAECLALLLAHNANPNLSNQNRWAPIHEAAGNDYPEILAQLLAHPTTDRFVMDNQGMTALAVAVERNAPGALAPLLTIYQEAGMLDGQDRNGETALFKAVKTENRDFLLQLIAAGANPAIPNHADQTPAELAASTGWSEGMALLGQAQRLFSTRAEAPKPSESAARVEEVPAYRASPLTTIRKRRFGP